MPGPWQCDKGYCDKSFGSKNALEHHKITHLASNVHCYGCTRTFTTYHGMMIHLESGTCKSGIEISRVNRLAALCYQWKKYTLKEFRSKLLNGDTAYRCNKDNLPFRCPTCLNSFPLVSSLFTHVWSPSCGQTVEDGAMRKLKRWLKKSLKMMKVRD